MDTIKNACWKWILAMFKELKIILCIIFNPCTKHVLSLGLRLPSLTICLRLHAVFNTHCTIIDPAKFILTKKMMGTLTVFIWKLGLSITLPTCPTCSFFLFLAIDTGDKLVQNPGQMGNGVLVFMDVDHMEWKNCHFAKYEGWAQERSSQHIFEGDSTSKAT